MVAIQVVGQSRPVAAVIVGVVTVAVAVLAAHGLLAPRDRKALRAWLAHAPKHMAGALARAFSPRAWWSAVSRHPRLWATVGAVLVTVTVGPLLGYRVSPRFRLAVNFPRVNHRAEGGNSWAPVIPHRSVPGDAHRPARAQEPPD